MWNSKLPSSLSGTSLLFLPWRWKFCYEVPKSCAQSPLYLQGEWKRHGHTLKPWHRILWLWNPGLFICLIFIKVSLNIHAFINPCVEEVQYANCIVGCSLCMGNQVTGVSTAPLESNSLSRKSYKYLTVLFHLWIHQMRRWPQSKKPWRIRKVCMSVSQFIPHATIYKIDNCL